MKGERIEPSPPRQNEKACYKTMAQTRMTTTTKVAKYATDKAFSIGSHISLPALQFSFIACIIIILIIYL